MINRMSHKLEHNNPKHRNGYISLNKSISGSCKLYEKMKLSQEKHEEQNEDKNELNKYIKKYINLTKKVRTAKKNDCYMNHMHINTTKQKERCVNCKCKVNYNKTSHPLLHSKYSVNNSQPKSKRNKHCNFPERYISHRHKHHCSSSITNCDISSIQCKSLQSKLNYNNNNNDLHYIH